MIPVIKKPAECKADELCNFVEMVIEGGQVTREGLERRIRRAKLMAFAYENEKLAGVAAIKAPSWLYVRDVFRKAIEAGQAVDFRYELGWGYTRPDFRRRGIHGRLTEMLMTNVRDLNVFGTTAVDNDAEKAILMRLGFERCGSPYAGRTESKQLWIRRVAPRAGVAKWALRNADLLLRSAERSERYNILLNSFRRKIRLRSTGVH
jgi:ribosomal protein S18 acetylase RimI-like enzyme